MAIHKLTIEFEYDDEDPEIINWSCGNWSGNDSIEDFWCVLDSIKKEIEENER